MNKVTIALLLLATMPLNGTKPKKPHRTPSREQYLAASAQLCARKIEAHHTSATANALQERKNTSATAEAAHKKMVDSRIKEHSDSGLKEFCIKVIVGGCLYVCLEHGCQISNYCNTTKF